MPRISDEILNCSVFLYESEKAAKDGDRAGGSGFLVHVASAHPPLVHPYVVTNKHVLDGGCNVLRLNTKDGASQALCTSPDSWTCHPTDDVAALQIDCDLDRFQWTSLGVDGFVTEDIYSDYNLGPGDEVFMIGRLVLWLAGNGIRQLFASAMLR
jgi:hypothetical protein